MLHKIRVTCFGKKPFSKIQIYKVQIIQQYTIMYNTGNNYTVGHKNLPLDINS